MTGLTEKLLASARAANLTILGFLVLVVVAFSLACPPGTFLSTGNLRSMALAASTVLVLGVGMTFLLIAGGLDLSVGAIVVFAAVAAARYLSSATVDPATGQERTGTALWERVLVGALIAVGVGLAWGVTNGLVVTWTRVPPFVATLASSTVVLGLAQVWTSGVNVSGAPIALQERFGLGLAFGQVPWPVVVAVVVTAIGWTVLAGSRFGLRLYAIGANPEAARRAGVRVGFYQVAAYALVGLLAGMVAFTEVARFTTATVSGYGSTALNVITAVVIGGTSLWGGRGNIAGTVVGSLIPAILTSGFVILGVQPFWQNVAVGLILLLAVTLDQYRRRVLGPT